MNPADLSRCTTEEEFLEKLQVALRNQREATVLGGFYGVIIGDIRRNGRYFSFQAPIISRMPQSELRAVLIKEQHHMVSNRIEYAHLKLPRITHEYAVLWQKEAMTPRNLS